MTRKQTRDALEVWGGYARRAAQLSRGIEEKTERLGGTDETLRRARASLKAAIRADRAEYDRITGVWARVEAAVAALNEDEREIIRRRYADRRGMVQIAVALGVSERTAYYYRRNAERKIGEALKKKAGRGEG